MFRSLAKAIFDVPSDLLKRVKNKLLTRALYEPGEVRITFVRIDWFQAGLDEVE